MALALKLPKNCFSCRAFVRIDEDSDPNADWSGWKCELGFLQSNGTPKEKCLKPITRKEYELAKELRNVLEDMHNVFEKK